MEVQILRVIKKGNKFQVFTNVDEFAVQFTEDSLVKNRVYKDKTFTINKWEEIKKQNGSLVLFSPTAPSFGYYKNFVARGEDFIKCVQNIK